MTKGRTLQSAPFALYQIVCAGSFRKQKIAFIPKAVYKNRRLPYHIKKRPLFEKWSFVYPYDK